MGSPGTESELSSIVGHPPSVAENCLVWEETSVRSVPKVPEVTYLYGK